MNQENDDLQTNPDKTTHPNEQEVTITINGDPYKLNRGVYTVAQIKALANIPAADELEEVRQGKLFALSDHASTNIKGNEIFVSHVRDSGSSAW